MFNDLKHLLNYFKIYINSLKNLKKINFLRIYSLQLQQKQFVYYLYELKSFVEYDEREQKQNKIKGVKIGTSNRSSSNLLKIGPSPLDYDVSKYKYPTRHASFGSAVRQSIITNDQTPGPGAYMIDSKLRKNGPIIPKASKDFSNLDNIPGPGKYRILILNLKININHFYQIFV